MEIDTYKRIKERSRTEIKVKGSRFIATADKITSKMNAENTWKDFKGEFFDASHNCMAYKVGPDGEIFRNSDDGEPHGSAGKPILMQINKTGLMDIIVNVTRYFGGTKLGVGGLVKAYSQAAEEVLKIAQTETVHLTNELKVSCGYPEIPTVKRIIDEYALEFEGKFINDVEFKVLIKLSQVDEFITKIESQTNRKARIAFFKRVIPICE